MTLNLGSHHPRRLRCRTTTAAWLLCAFAACTADANGPAGATQPGVAGASDAAAAPAPFVLEKSFTLNEVPAGPYSDYLAIDPRGGTLFATPQAAKAVAVIRLANGSVQKMIGGIGNSHGIYYDDALRRLFVADGASGDVKVYGGGNFDLIKTIPLAKGADWLIYDPADHCIYVNNGGEDAGMDHALVSAVNTESLIKVADIPIAAAGLEASVIDPQRGLLYVNLVNEGDVAVVDLARRTVTTRWHLQPGHRNMAITLDVASRRLYVATRDNPMHGSVIVLDADSGKTLVTLPIGGWADSISLDLRRRRLYITTGVGYLQSIQIEPHDIYRMLPSVDTAVMAKTGLYSSELDRMYVSVPHLGGTPAQIMVFAPGS